MFNLKRLVALRRSSAEISGWVPTLLSGKFFHQWYLYHSQGRFVVIPYYFLLIPPEKGSSHALAILYGPTRRAPSPCNGTDPATSFAWFTNNHRDYSVA